MTNQARTGRMDQPNVEECTNWCTGAHEFGYFHIMTTALWIGSEKGPQEKSAAPANESRLNLVSLERFVFSLAGKTVEANRKRESRTVNLCRSQKLSLTRNHSHGRLAVLMAEC